ncbi:MAG: hypothetical protein U0992_07750 [Planctomycetaceae bacterium]
MKTRMQPIRNAWNKLPPSSGTCQACHKQVQVKMEGADTELDKTILEAIRDPLTRIVRNSVDHGIEAPRCGRGKPAEEDVVAAVVPRRGQGQHRNLRRRRVSTSIACGKKRSRRA